MSDKDHTEYELSLALADTTPSRRVSSASMSEEAKRRVDHATSSDQTLTENRCLIENTDRSNAVEYAHCLDRAAKERLLSSLEFAWKMPRFTLNTDTRYNVMRLSPKFHRLFVSNAWLLLPDTHSLNKLYIERKKPGEFAADLTPRVYEYTLLAHPSLRPVLIHRQNLPTNPIVSLFAEDFTSYIYPYDNFPTIFSHVHPRYIVCNSGPKLPGRLTEWFEAYTSRFVDLAKLGDIWTAWERILTKKSPEVETFFGDKSRHDDADFNDNDSQKTAPHRAPRSHSSKRKSPEEHGSPTWKGQKQQKVAHEGAWLDDETLEELDQQNSLHTGDLGYKKRFVLDWLRLIPSSTCKVGFEDHPEDG